MSPYIVGNVVHEPTGTKPAPNEKERKVLARYFAKPSTRNPENGQPYWLPGVTIRGVGVVVTSTVRPGTPSTDSGDER